MAFLGKEIDVDTVPESDYTPIPAGDYHLKITDCELKDARSGGTYIKLSYDVIGPSHQGRKVFGMITISNPSQKAEEIGSQQVASLCRALGIKKLSDTDQLIGGEFTGSVAIKPGSDDGKYGPQNEVKRYKSLDNAAPFVAAPKPAATAAPASDGKPPWAK